MAKKEEFMFQNVTNCMQNWGWVQQVQTRPETNSKFKLQYGITKVFFKYQGHKSIKGHNVKMDAWKKCLISKAVAIDITVLLLPETMNSYQAMVWNN